MILRTSAVLFISYDPSDLKLKCRNSNAGNPFTKIFAYVGGNSIQITDSTGNFVDLQ